MNIPTFIVVQYVRSDGFLTDEMQYYEDQMNQVLRNGLSNNGWTFPKITAADLALISPDMPDGTAWYENDNHQIVFKVNGALRKITTTAYP